jgi:hypothetical protein
MKKNSLYLIGGIIVVVIIVLIVLNYLRMSKEHFRGGGGGHGGGGGAHSSTGGHSNNSARAAVANSGGSSSNSSSTNITPTPSTIKNSGKKPDCFSKDSLLKLENGSSIKIEDAKIGDKILSYSLNKNSFIYSPIVAIPHEKNSIESDFIEIKTLSGKNIKMTSDHLIPVLKNKNNKFETIYAKNIDIDDIIITIDGNDKVTSKEVIKEEGIYTVITLEEYIVVDNIVVSPYAIFHLLGNIYYCLHKTLYCVNPDIVKSAYFEKFNKNNNVFYNKVVSIF